MDVEIMMEINGAAEYERNTKSKTHDQIKTYEERNMNAECMACQVNTKARTQSLRRTFLHSDIIIIMHHVCVCVYVLNSFVRSIGFFVINLSVVDSVDARIKFPKQSVEAVTAAICPFIIRN